MNVILYRKQAVSKDLPPPPLPISLSAFQREDGVAPSAVTEGAHSSLK